MKPGYVFAAILMGIAPAIASDALPEGAAAAGKFTRFEEDPFGSRLQTGIGSYRGPDGVTVDLIGAIHVADKAYYERLNRRFTRYDAVLYELVGESFEKRWKWLHAKEILEETIREKSERERNSPLKPEDRVKNLEAYLATLPPVHDAIRSADEAKKLEEERLEEEAAGGNLTWLHSLYESIEKTLGLTGQIEGINYRRKNFVHADMNLREFSAMQRQKNESFFTLWWKTVLAQSTQSGASMEQPGLLKIMESLCRQDGSVGLRRIAARTFGSMEGMIAGLDSKEGTVILTERNKVALKVLEEQIKLGKKNLAVFYGAAHLADMERRLLAMGFVRTGGEWFNAWDMPPEGAGGAERR